MMKIIFVPKELGQLENEIGDNGKIIAFYGCAKNCYCYIVLTKEGEIYAKVRSKGANNAYTKVPWYAEIVKNGKSYLVQGESLKRIRETKKTWKGGKPAGHLHFISTEHSRTISKMDIPVDKIVIQDGNVILPSGIDKMFYIHDNGFNQ